LRLGEEQVRAVAETRVGLDGRFGSDRDALGRVDYGLVGLNAGVTYDSTDAKPLCRVEEAVGRIVGDAGIQADEAVIDTAQRVPSPPCSAPATTCSPAPSSAARCSNPISATPPAAR
jgi:hypothetical protein